MKIVQNPPVCGDTDDDKFLVSAVSGKANIIVSGDSDLLQISSQVGIQVLKPKAFVDRFPDESR